MRKSFIYLISVFIFSGCMTKQEVLTPSTIEDIQSNKIIDRTKDIYITHKSLARESYQAFVDKDNKLKYLCYQGNEDCNYYDENKHSYLMNNKPSEDIIWVYNDSFSPNFSKDTRNVQCGTGNMGGYFVLIPGIDLKDYDNLSPEVCNSRFTTLDSLQIGTRLVSGIVTLGSSLVTSGSMHTVKFDEEEFRNTIIETNLDSYQNELFEIAQKNNIKTGLEIIYLNTKDIFNLSFFNPLKQSLENAYIDLENNKSNSEGIIFIDENTKKIISTIIFKNFTSKSIMKNITSQVNKIYDDIAKESTKSLIKTDDIIKYIPPEIQKPSLPKVPKLSKDEFETKEQFKQRIQNAVKLREEQIKNIQKEYDLEVFERNEYIKNLQNSYNNFLVNNLVQNNTLLTQLNKNIQYLINLLFIANLEGFDAKDFVYDAEKQRLYFYVYSKKRYITQKVFANIEASIAKKIKIDGSYKITPKLEYINNSLILKTFYITELQSNNFYEVKYSNINFKPIKMQVQVKTLDENINSSDFEKFQTFEQKKQKLIDNSKKEIWYIDTVERINAKIPKWFIEPIQTKDIISYANGESLQEAKAKALTDLAYMKKVQVTSSFELTKESNNSFKTFKDVKNDIKTSTDIKLSSNEYSVYKQEQIDGIWYVALKYKGKI